MLNRIILKCQVAFSYALFMFGFLMFISCLSGGYHAVYCVAFAVFCLLAYLLVVATRKELEGGES